MRTAVSAPCRAAARRRLIGGGCHAETAIFACRLRRIGKAADPATTSNRTRPHTNARSFATKPDRGEGLVPSGNNDLPATSSEEESLLAIPIDFDAASKVSGEESQIVEVTLKPNQILRAESGAMLYMTTGIKMETTTGGGLSAGFKRMLTGQNLMVSDFSYDGEDSGIVALGTDFPSKIMRLNLEEYGGKIVCQKRAYLAGSHTVDIQMEFAKKLTAGFFGGEGFVLQSLQGEGDVFVKAGGTLVRKELRGGESLRISSGCLVAFTQDVEYDVQTMPGFKNVMFGGEGLFVTTLTGQGTVWLQGMPPDRMISEIARRVPGGGGIGLGIPIGVGGAGGGEVGDEAGDVVVAGEADAEGTEDMVAATDAAVEADRNATVASSGLSAAEDPDSPSSLFGDAAAPDDMATQSASSTPDESSDFYDETTFSTEEEAVDFGEDVTEQVFDDFDQDETTFSTTDEGSAGGQEDEFDVGADAGGGEEGESIFKQLWDFFTDDD